MTRGRRIATGLIALLAIGLIVAWWLLNFERETKITDLPPRGEAKYNRAYGLQKILESEGQRVEVRARLQFLQHRPAARDTIVLLEPARAMPAAELDALLAWVEGGGHLIAPMDDGWGARSIGGGAESGRPTDKSATLMKRLGVEVVVDDGDRDQDTEFCAKLWTVRDGKPVADDAACFDDHFKVPDGSASHAWSDRQGLVFARMPRGHGSVDVLSSMWMATGTDIEKPTNAALMRQLLAPNWGAGTIHVVRDTDMPPLWRLVAESAWMLFVPLVLALSGWLWMRAQRLGPLLPSPPDERRSLLEHVQATGDHLYRYGRAHLLHAALRTHVIARLRRRDPIGAALEGQAQAERLAAHTGLPAADIASALQTPRPFDARDFRQRIARLIALGRHA